jgi:hypothetical protein
MRQAYFKTRGHSGDVVAEDGFDYTFNSGNDPLQEV